MPIPALAYVAAAGAAGYVLYKKFTLTEGQKAVAASVPAGQVVPEPPPPAPALTQTPIFMPTNAEPGQGAAVWLTFDPNDTSVANNVRALRFLELSALIPSDVAGDPANEDYQMIVMGFQAAANLPPTGMVDARTQNALTNQVIARNKQVHNQNVRAGLTDSDWITLQNKAGAEDPRGSWSVSGISLSVPGLPAIGGLVNLVSGRAGHRQADLIGGRAGHRQADLIGKRSGHRQADLIGGKQVQVFGKRWGRGGAHASLVGRTSGYGTAFGGVDLLREGRRIARKHLGV